MKLPNIDREAETRRVATCARTVHSGRSASVAGFDAPNLSGMRDDQREGILFLRSLRHALLADEMGLGKSAQALRAIRAPHRVIVVCPASLHMVWETETRKFRPDLRVTNLQEAGEELRRPDERELLIVSYDSLPTPPSGGRRSLLNANLSDVDLILDECHLTKTDTALRTIKVRKLGQQCRHVWGLTGTPMLGNPHDLWGVLTSLGLANIFQDKEAFVKLCNGKRRVVFDERSKGAREVGWIWGEVSPEVRERLGAVMLRRRRADILDLPPVQYVDVPVPTPPDLRDYLDKQKEAWDEIDPHSLPPFELLSEARAALARSRIPAAIEYADNMAASLSTIVFSAHVDPVLAVGALKGAGTITGATPPRERKKAVERFKSRELRILAMTIDAGGVGLNLPEAGGILFVDRDYTPALNDQAEARALRPGQVHASVLVARMISDHPLDKRLQEILNEKQRLISAAID